MSKISMNLPETLIENLDYLAEEMETDRTDVVTEILQTIMESEDLLDLIFGETLENAVESDNEGETETENTDDDESEEEESEEPESSEKTY